MFIYRAFMVVCQFKLNTYAGPPSYLCRDLDVQTTQWPLRSWRLGIQTTRWPGTTKDTELNSDSEPLLESFSPGLALKLHLLPLSRLRDWDWYQQVYSEQKTTRNLGFFKILIILATVSGCKTNIFCLTESFQCHFMPNSCQTLLELFIKPYW